MSATDPSNSGGMAVDRKLGADDTAALKRQRDGIVRDLSLTVSRPEDIDTSYAAALAALT